MICYLIFSVLIAAAAFTVRRRSLLRLTGAAFYAVQAAFAVRIVAGGLYGETSAVWFAFDAAGTLFYCLLCIVSAFAFFHSKASLHDCDLRQTRTYAGLLMLLTTAIAGAYFASNLAVTWIFLEATTLCSAGIIYHRRTAQALEAAWKYVFVCSTGIAMAYLGILLLAAATDCESLDYATVAAAAPGGSALYLKTAFLLILCGYSCKAELFPLYTVGVDANFAAPAPASALISTGLVNAGFLALLRVYKLLAETEVFPWVKSVLLLVGVLMKIAMPQFRTMQQRVDDVNLVSRELLTGLPVIRAFHRERHEEERFDTASAALMKTQLFVNRTMAFMGPVMTLIMYGVTVMIEWFGAKSINAGNMQIGDMIAFSTYASLIIMAFMMITIVAVLLPRAEVSATRVDEILRTRASVRDPRSPEPAPADATVTFDHVSFRYPGAEDDVLHDISFTARPGEVTAIVGSTGCGKSTLLNLIPRFYDATGGTVSIGGVNVRRLHQADLRAMLGYVPQKGVLFTGDILSNLEFGGNVSEADAIRAAATAQAEDFIWSRPHHFLTPVAQGGANVSGGQRQRLSIARAIARHPQVYLFDDSFSALDYQTDAALRQALAKQTHDATVIIVAQRLSTILHADQILVLDGGRIVGRGTHSALLRSCETYREIALSQLSAAELGEEG